MPGGAAGKADELTCLRVAADHGRPDRFARRILPGDSPSLGQGLDFRLAAGGGRHAENDVALKLLLANQTIYLGLW